MHSRTSGIALAGAGILLVWMAMVNIHPIQDPDIWWHLASGRYMVEHGIVPKTDVFSLTAQGSAWIDTYWLQEIAVYLVYTISGLTGLIVTNAVSIALVVFLIGYCNPAKNSPWQARLLGILWIFLASHPRGYGWGKKASFVTFGFLGLLFYALNPENRPLALRWAKFWPLVFMIWANMHRGFIVGLAILGFYVLEALIKKSEERIRLGFLWLFSAAATLINPYGARVYSMGWQDYHLSPTYVQGWAQTPFHHLELFWATLVLFWCVIAWEFWKHKPVGTAFSATSLFLCLFSIRYASLYPYFMIWAVPWLVSQIDWRARRGRMLQAFSWIILSTTAISITPKPAFGINKHIFPVDAAEFLKDTGLRAPFFHEYEFGGYFLWALNGQPPVLIDGRYPAVQGYQTLYPEMQRVIQGTPDDFHRFLSALHIHAAVVKYPSTQFLAVPFALYFPRKEWALIYWDDVVLIFVERQPPFQDMIQKYEFQTAEPDANPEFWLKRIWAPASVAEKARMRQEFLTNAERHPDSRKARFWCEITSPT